MAGATDTARAGFASALFGLPRSDRDERRLRARRWPLLERARRRRRGAARRPATLPYAVAQAGRAGPRAGRPSPGCCCSTSRPAASAPRTSSELAELIRGLPDARDCSVLLVEHHMDLVMAVCDEIVVLDFGKVDRARHARRDPRRPGRRRGLPRRRTIDAGRGIDDRAAAARSAALTAGYGAAPGAARRRPDGRAGHHRRRARRQRRRQDHAAAHPLRPGPADRRPGRLRRARPARGPVEELVRRGMAHVPRAAAWSPS